jgi:hypothetical protein
MSFALHLSLKISLFMRILSLFSTLLMLSTVVLFTQCKSPKSTVPTDLGKPSLVQFLDSTTASKAIVDDDIDGFFDQISIVDMAIQMKTERTASDRNKVLTTYKSFLRTSVSTWTMDEKEKLFNLFTRAKAICDKVSPRLYPGSIRLIKIKTNHYGPDVYYTRGRDILIPENIFDNYSEERQLPVMLHEIFHIYSRYNEKTRTDLYNLIGFKKSDRPVVLDANLAKIILTNPDGVSMNYYMTLSNDGKATDIVPCITSKNRTFKTTSPAFFDYLNFDLYKITKSGTGFITESDANGKTTLDVSETPSFFAQIKDNTQYIIHPDEIMADNFMLGLLALDKNEFDKFSPAGKKLIDDMIQILRSI